MSYHVGRSFNGTPLEDKCPCVKEPCGLVNIEKADPNCMEHPPFRVKTLRQGHSPERCPGKRED